METERQRALTDARNIVWDRILTQSRGLDLRGTRVLLHAWYYLRVQLGQIVPVGKERKYGNEETAAQKAAK